MILNLDAFQYDPASVITILAFHLNTGYFRTNAAPPEIITLRIIACFSCDFILGALAINVYASLEVRVKLPRVIPHDFFRYDAETLIQKKIGSASDTPPTIDSAYSMPAFCRSVLR